MPPKAITPPAQAERLRFHAKPGDPEAEPVTPDKVADIGAINAFLHHCNPASVRKVRDSIEAIPVAHPTHDARDRRNVGEIIGLLNLVDSDGLQNLRDYMARRLLPPPDLRIAPATRC